MLAGAILMMMRAMLAARGPWIVIWDIRADLSVTGTGAEPPVVRNFVSGPSGNDGECCR